MLLVTGIHIIVATLIILVVLLQQGKGSGLGSSFDSSSSQTIFGGRGSAPFLFKFTAFLAVVFFVTSISLNYLRKDIPIEGVSQSDYQSYLIHKKMLSSQTSPPTRSDK
jgi:preprotein translocase subunit SecG